MNVPESIATRFAEPAPTMPKGVEFNAPPASMLASVMKQIDEHIATLPPDADAALVSVATNKGVNAAFIARVPGGFEVQTWIGKSWGDKTIDAGAGVKKVFRWGK